MKLIWIDLVEKEILVLSVTYVVLLLTGTEETVLGSSGLRVVDYLQPESMPHERRHRSSTSNGIGEHSAKRDRHQTQKVMKIRVYPSQSGLMVRMTCSAVPLLSPPLKRIL